MRSEASGIRVCECTYVQWAELTKQSEGSYEDTRARQELKTHRSLNDEVRDSHERDQKRGTRDTGLKSHVSRTGSQVSGRFEFNWMAPPTASTRPLRARHGVNGLGTGLGPAISQCQAVPSPCPPKLGKTPTGILGISFLNVPPRNGSTSLVLLPILFNLFPALHCDNGRCYFARLRLQWKASGKSTELILFR